jgi:putative phosphoribosyl transferase
LHWNFLHKPSFSSQTSYDRTAVNPKQENKFMNRTSDINAQECLVSLTVGSITVKGNLEIPKDAQGVVLFARSSGSSQNSSRDRYIAQALHQARLATLIVDLLTPQEEAIDRRMRHLHYDLGLLAERLVGATDWLLQNPATQNLKIGYLGTSTDSGAAMLAALERPTTIGAIVSCDGRPDLAGSALSRVQAPTLFIVGEDNLPAVAMNQAALMQLHTEKQIELIPGATHEFEESGALEEVARLVTQWFERYLTPVDQQDIELLVQKD